MPGHWSLTRRWTFGIGGACVGLTSLVLGLTVVAAAGTRERGGGVIVLSMMLVSLMGFYFAGAGLWGEWVPRLSTPVRTRTVRGALIWAMLVGLYMFLSLPLTSFREMSSRESISAVALLVLLVISGIAIAAITRRPRIVAHLLSLAGVYSAVMLVGILRLLAFPEDGALAGPAVALSLLLAGSMCVALVAAAL